MTGTRRELGEAAHPIVAAVLRDVEAWQEANSRVVDYRLSEAITGLRRAEEGLRLLAVNGHSAEFDAALRDFRRRLNAEYAADGG